MIAWLAEALVASALLMALVLLIRRPVRRAFGPQVAYLLWLLPALRLLLPPLPAQWREAAATPISRASETITVLVVPADPGATASVAATPASIWPVVALGFAALWAIGAAAFLLWHGLGHARFRRRLLSAATPMERLGRIEVVESGAATGPLAFGILRRYVAFPRDFAERYDADERALALAHELGHHARGDLYANWAALVVLALHWFNPLAWRAFHAFRADQELANDARVLAGRSAIDRHAYACAIVKAAHGGAVSAACHLHTVDDLKGRLKMLTTSKSSRRRLAAGALSVGTIVLAGLGLTASGTQAAETLKTAAGIDLSQVELPAPPSVPVAPEQATPPVAPVAKGRHVHRVVVVRDGKRTIYEGAAADAFAAANPPPPPPAAPTPPIVPVAATPPLPPLAPMAPMPPQRMRVIVRDRDGEIRSQNFGDLPRPGDVPQVQSMTCPPAASHAQQFVIRRQQGDKRFVIICTDRINAASARAAEAATRAQMRSAEAQQRAAAAQARGVQMQRDALQHALQGLQASRTSMLANRDMADWERRNVADSIDQSIRQVEAQLAGIKTQTGEID